MWKKERKVSKLDVLRMFIVILWFTRSWNIWQNMSFYPKIKKRKYEVTFCI